jgi:hypothetical protein
MQLFFELFLSKTQVIKDFSLKEDVYPAKFDTVFGSIGFERVEIDLSAKGRIPSGEMKLGKAKKTIILWDEGKESIVIDSICSWVNITGLNEPRLYRFVILTEDQYGNRSTPTEIALMPYTSEDLKILALTPPRIMESTSSALLEWQSRISSVYFTMYDYRYDYIDKDNQFHSGEGLGDLPGFYVENVQQGRDVTVNMTCRILPISEGKQILDTIDWNTRYMLNISEAALPFIFLKTPEPLHVIHMTDSEFPIKFSWTKLNEVNDYTLKVSGDPEFPPEASVSIPVGDADEFELEQSMVETLYADFHVREFPLYWTVMSSVLGGNIRNQIRQFVGQKPKAKVSLWDGCEELAGWTGWKGGHYLDRDCKEGTYCVALTAPNVVAFQKTFNPVNTGLTKQNGYMGCWIYVSDIGAAGPPLNDDTQFEISSSGGPDQRELSWGWGHLNLHTGWNEVELPFSLGQDQGGEIDLNYINHLRFFSWRFDDNPALTVKIDYLHFYTY